MHQIPCGDVKNAGTTALRPIGSVLRRINGPADVRSLSPAELDLLAADIRSLLIDRVCASGGHLGPNLGVVELTIALHRVFESPHDRIIWDTGHQAYVHKMLTGRAEAFDTLRQQDGLSGYPAPEESCHDLVANSHASTALSWADGTAKANQLLGDGRKVVAVVGDGSLTGGMAWEGLNNLAAAPDRPVVVVLNDNGRSYAPTIGGLAEHLTELRTHAVRSPGVAVSNTVFAAMGMDYLGPIDGHDIGAVETALRAAVRCDRSVVVHCITTKGKGFEPAIQDTTHSMHTIPPSTPDGRPIVAAPPDWTGVFADELVRLAAVRPDLVAITAAMLGPVGLERFAAAYPDRCFDVGIAEQHAVASAAALAVGGMHPVVSIYATFLNRAFDQVLMDVALHRLPVTFVLDRAGITGDDGPSHNGVWDLAMLQMVPGLRIAAPRDGARLRSLLGEAVATTDGPTVVRYPKGAPGPDIPAVGSVGQADVLARSPRSEVLIVAVGPMAAACLAAADQLMEYGIESTVVDPRWIKPVDDDLVRLAADHRLVVTVEDGMRVGGVGSVFAQALADADIDVHVRNFGAPPRFLPHAKRNALLAETGLAPDELTAAIRLALVRSRQGIRQLAPIQRRQTA